MGFTDHCSVYAAIHEAGINLIINHMMTQRPLLFNYATDHFNAKPSDFCNAISFIQEVKDRKNPLFTLQAPLPIIGAQGVAGLDYCFQIASLQIDFHPGNVLTLPPQLNPPLAAQGVAMKLRVCGAILCPDRAQAEHYGEVVSDKYGHVVRFSDFVQGQDTFAAAFDGIGVATVTKDTVALSGVPQCFCLDVYATAHMENINVNGINRLGIKLDGLEIVDITPDGLENSIECYLINVLRVGILPRIRVALDTVMFNIGGFLSLSVTPTPTSGFIPFNPSVDSDQVKVFINVA
jgi:hypothetical protein